MVDLWAGFGGFFYAVGTSLFEIQLIPAVWLFICGGTSFTISGISMQYRYFCAAKAKTTETENNEKSNNLFVKQDS